MSSFGNIALDKNKVAVTHFSDLVEQLRSGLARFGIKKGDVVGIVSGNLTNAITGS